MWHGLGDVLPVPVGDDLERSVWFDGPHFWVENLDFDRPPIASGVNGTTEPAQVNAPLSQHPSFLSAGPEAAQSNQRVAGPVPGPAPKGLCPAQGPTRRGSYRSLRPPVRRAPNWQGGEPGRGSPQRTGRHSKQGAWVDGAGAPLTAPRNSASSAIASPTWRRPAGRSLLMAGPHTSTSAMAPRVAASSTARKLSSIRALRPASSAAENQPPRHSEEIPTPAACGPRTRYLAPHSLTRSRHRPTAA